ncbi:AAA family ATPase [Nocardia sp. BSTN01]|uniref:AAA family ATPase n=1 Tax=Nocardia sp. BSTN01 TaxID=2783665 RepID=UPI00188FC2A1|nr:AAA family ATPase [Nocardia sp. BSTN01]MBF5001802.1 AAA family ATPase [Nocardia sp. BSTN01]
MFVWLNGSFGAGKTSIAKELVAADPQHWRLFDPEFVGFMLRAQFADAEVNDFQDLPSWRRLVPFVADDIATETGQNLVIVQTVLNQRYWTEITNGIAELEHPLRHVLIDARPQTLRQRISEDEVLHRAANWRLQHVPTYINARDDWLANAADLVIDTTSLSPVRAAAGITEAIDRWATDDTSEGWEGLSR